MRQLLAFCICALSVLIGGNYAIAKKLSSNHYEFCIGDDATIVNEEAKRDFLSGGYDEFKGGGSWHFPKWECIEANDYSITFCFTKNVNGANLEHWYWYKKYGYTKVVEKYTIDVKKPSVTLSGIPEECRVGDKVSISAELEGDFPAFESGGYFTYEFSSSNKSMLKLSNTSKGSSNRNSFDVISADKFFGDITVKVYAENSKYNITPIYVTEETVKVSVRAKAKDPESIKISPDAITIGVNETKYLDCTVLPSGASQDVTWKSDDPTVATVSSSGKVTGKKKGTTTVTAKTTNGLTSKCKVTVAELYLIDGIRYRTYTSTGVANVYPLSSGKYKGDIVIPQKVTINGKSYDVHGIGENAFKDCTGLNSIILPDGVAIFDCAFYGCTKLTSMRLNGVKWIFSSAFEGCSGLTVIQLSGENHNRYFYKDAFKGCNNLKKVYIDNLNSWVNSAIYNNATGNPLWPGNAELYLNGEKVVNLTVPVPEDKKLGFGLFICCSSIESVSFQNGIERIEGRVFQNCDNLKLVTLPSSLLVIDGYAFAYCDNITTVNCYATTPPNMQTGWDDYSFNDYFAFNSSSPQKITLHVPKGCMQAYANAPGWNLFGLIIDDLVPEAGINDIVVDSQDNATNNVYNLQGMLIKQNATQEEIESLPEGIYIIGGKKVFVR